MDSIMCESAPSKLYLSGSVPRILRQSSLVNVDLNSLVSGLVGSSRRSCHGTPPMTPKKMRSVERGPRVRLQSASPLSAAFPSGRLVENSGLLQLLSPV